MTKEFSKEEALLIFNRKKVLARGTDDFLDFRNYMESEFNKLTTQYRKAKWGNFLTGSEFYVLSIKDEYEALLTEWYIWEHLIENNDFINEFELNDDNDKVIYPETLRDIRGKYMVSMEYTDYDERITEYQVVFTPYLKALKQLHELQKILLNA